MSEHYSLKCWCSIAEACEESSGAAKNEMPPQYHHDQIVQLENDQDAWLRRGHTLAENFLGRNFFDSSAELYAREGLSRRLGYLDHALVRLNEVYPPNSSNASRSTVRDAELILQAFIMNVFGAIDNLAWIWSLERSVTRPDGKPLKRTERVFTGEKSRYLINSLTPEIRTIISEASDWFNNIGNYRHGIAHQIPVYIPRMLSQSDVDALGEITTAIDEAIAQNDSQQVSNLVQRRFALGDFGPYMALSGNHDPMLLHAQMLCDYATVVQLGEAIFRNIDVN